MNKYLSKAVLYTERKNIVYGMLCYSLIYLVNIYNFIRMLLNSREWGSPVPPNPQLGLNFYFRLFSILAIIIVMISYSEKDKKYYYMLTQPYSKTSIIVTRTIGYIITYAVPSIIYGIIASIIIVVNKADYMKVNDNYYNSVITSHSIMVFKLIAVTTCIIMLTQLFQMLFGKTVGVVIIPFILGAFLYLSLRIMSQFISRNLGPIRSYIGYLTSFIFEERNIKGQGIGTLDLQTIIKVQLFKSDGLGFSVILLVLALAVFIVSLSLNNRIKAENTSEVFMFKGSEITAKVITTLFFTIFLSLLFSVGVYYVCSSIFGMPVSTYLIRKYGLAGKEAMENNIYLILNILWIPIFMLIYRLFSRTERKRRQ